MGSTLFFRRFILAFIGFGIILSSGFAHAQLKKTRIKNLTDENVTAFINDTTAMTSISNVDADPKKVRNYLDKHISPKARFKSSIRYMMPGLPAQEKSLSLSKADYIEQVQQGAGSVEHYHSEIMIEDIDIAKDKKSVSVSTVSTETGLMQVANPEGPDSSVPIEGRSECFQVLRLSKKGLIQMFSANCKTVMEFLPY